MNITLKNIKHSEFASQETHCFEATVYVDGKRSFIAKNDGHGGDDYYYPINGETMQDVHNKVDIINAELGKEKVKYNLDNCLEFVVSDLINEWLRDKEIKKILKKVAYVRGTDLYTLPAKYKPTTEMLKKMKQQDWWKPEYKLLNEMPIEEVRQYFQ